MFISPWIRLVIAISLDGRLAFPDGGKAKLGGEGDRRVLEEALAWCDGTLMGSGTLRAHKNTCMIHNSKLIQKRREQGLSDQPVSVIVSRQKSFSKKWEFFEQPIKRWLLSSELKSQLSSIREFDRHFLIKETWGETLSDLNQEGCSKIVLLGGKELITSLLLEDTIDELQLTFTPRILGGKYTWTGSNMNNLPRQLTESNSWSLKSTEDLGENEVMLKYFRNRS